MKINKFLFVLCINIILIQTTNAQANATISPSFFSTEHQRVSVGVNMDYSFAGKSGKTGLTKAIGEGINNDNIFYDKPSVSYGIGLDYYSPNSILGFYLEVNYNTQKYSLRNPIYTYHDSLTVTNIDVPIYAKFRFGKVNKHNHVWLAIGAGYSKISKVELTTYNDITNAALRTTDDTNLFSSVIYTSAILGYEMILPFSEANGREEFDRDAFRLLLYAKVNQDLNNRINTEQTSAIQYHVVETFTNSELKFRRISFGIKLLMRFKSANDLIKETVKKQQQSY